MRSPWNYSKERTTIPAQPKQPPSPSPQATARNRKAGRLLGFLIRSLGRTLRISWQGRERLDAAQMKATREGQGALFAVWHGQLMVPAIAVRDRDYVVLVSRSGDGEMAASAMQELGWQVRRGSQFWGSIEAARGVLRALRDGQIVAVTPDGPRGPAEEAAPGAVFVAARAGCDLFPVGVAGRGWYLPTWDRLFIPRPFSSAVIVVGPPVRPTDIATDAVERGTKELQIALGRATTEAGMVLRNSMNQSRNRQKFLLYNTALLPLLPALYTYTLWRRYVKKKSSASWHGQWGRIPGETLHQLRPTENSDAPVVWLHAVSVGEVMAARPILRALRAALPYVRLGVSVTTDTGYETAQNAIKAGEADALWYFPIDAPVAVRRALNAIRPDVFITMETELWPNFLSEAHRRGIRTLLVNGRVSDRLMKSVPRLKPLWRWMLGNLDGLLMRSEFDAERLRSLARQIGVVEPAISVTGDVKLDSLQPGSGGEVVREQWRAALGIGPQVPLWVAGSTHPGEEETILEVYGKLRSEFPRLRLLIAPRHIERTAEVAEAIRRSRHSVALRSEKKFDDPDAVLLLDTVGELADIYAAGDIAFVGGSLIQRGGHNMMEPVLRGVPVIFGPHIANFREIATFVRDTRTGEMVNDEGELFAAVRCWLSDASLRREVGKRAEDALEQHRGAADEVARIVAEQLSAKREL